MFEEVGQLIEFFIAQRLLHGNISHRSFHFQFYPLVTMVPTERLGSVRWSSSSQLAGSAARDLVPLWHLYLCMIHIYQRPCQSQRKASMLNKWVTRERPKSDRIACPWLIRRFIARDAEVICVPTEQGAR